MAGVAVAGKNKNLTSCSGFSQETGLGQLGCVCVWGRGCEDPTTGLAVVGVAVAGKEQEFDLVFWAFPGDRFGSARLWEKPPIFPRRQVLGQLGWVGSTNLGLG